MENIIFLTLDLVYPDDTGGRKLSLGRILYEQEKGNNVTVIHYNYKKQDEEDAQRFFKENNICFYSFSPRHNHHGFTRLLCYMKSFLNKMPEPYYMIYRDDFFHHFLDAKIEEIAPSLISLESIFLGWTENVIRSKKVKINYTFHNVESEFYYSLFVSEVNKIKKAHYYIQSLLLEVIERRILNDTSANVTYTFLSKEDMSEYMKKYNISRGNIIINHNNIKTSNKVNRKVDFAEPFFLFPGSLDFPANSFAIKNMLETPNLNWDLLPRIIITGTVSYNTRKKFLGLKNISLVGRVSEDELYRLYSSCIACISPIVTGAGIKIKNLEAIKLGVPLIATKFSCVGINTSNENIFLTENNFNSFYEVMLKYYNEVLNKL
ncbi:glycosyltransferase [Salmonella enterica]|nr:glycosyltransferase family 4 protein [Salmonella enterica]EEP9818307.1 glycosyltransferase family 4 protein [Salmonella enterica subsp. arizonae]EHA8426253.1 glycosyltransferase family 4 protein [Salmonella enterica subsp. arizonae serovar 41:z4,z23:-]QVP42924.1 glycosyltransferase [Salmonella enterica subsp. arizonae serovar 41:z4,z23:- str. 01-0089]EFP6236597.1 glycosyltransferase family 4 protein [Salmonella enterica]